MKKKLVVSILYVFLINLSITGCSSKVEKLALESSIEYMKKEEYIEARNELINFVDEGNDEIDEVFSIIENYLRARDNYPKDLEKVEEYLKKAKNYDKYPIKDNIDELKEKVKARKKAIAEFDEQIKELDKFMNKEKYDEAEEIINKIMIDDYSTESQKKYATDCRSTIAQIKSEEERQKNAEIANKIKEENEQEIKRLEEEKIKIEEDFTKEKAIELVNELNTRNNTEYLYEVVSDIKYDENNKKYCEIVSRYADWVKFEDYTIISYMRIYADGTTTFE